MASGTYALVCYVNQVTALYLSKNYPVIPIFLARSHEALLQSNHARVSEQYRRLVLQYLSHVAHFIVEFACLREDEAWAAELIPKALLELRPEPLPEDLVVPGEF
jgi:hypothetical protein